MGQLTMQITYTFMASWIMASTIQKLLSVAHKPCVKWYTDLGRGDRVTYGDIPYRVTYFQGFPGYLFSLENIYPQKFAALCKYFKEEVILKHLSMKISI